MPTYQHINVNCYNSSVEYPAIAEKLLFNTPLLPPPPIPPPPLSPPSEHWNYFGIDEALGPVAVSLRREKLEEDKDHGQQYNYRIIFRTSEVSLVPCPHTGHKH